MDSLKARGAETLGILRSGRYTTPRGATRRIGHALDQAVNRTTLYTPDALDDALHRLTSPTPPQPTRIEVTDARTHLAARRLVEDEGFHGGVMLLCFASARNVCGGFLTGARAQEEDLARASGLYLCAEAQTTYYEANRAHATSGARDALLYTDHMFHAPDVPFFRGEDDALTEAPYLVSVLTAPAPNLGAHLRRHADGAAEARRALHQRAGYVLTVARDQGHRALVLGAWGCGVFRNDPHEVADTFATWLADARFAGAFDRVVFAIHDTTRDHRVRSAFEARLG